MPNPNMDALGLGTANALIGQDIAGTQQARATIANRDSAMQGILKSFDDQKFDKPPPQLDAKPFEAPPMQDPAKAWGAPTAILAMIGSLATRHPLTASLKSATAAMNAVKQGNADAYQAAFTQWKANTDLAFKRADWENDQYKEAMDLFNTNFEHGLAKLNTLATLNKDTAMLATLQSGNISDITGLLNARANLSRAASEAQEKLATVGEQISEWNDWKKKNPTATSDDRIAAHQRIFPSTAGGSRGMFRSLPAAFAQKYLQEHPNATADDLELAAEKYNMMQSGGRTLGTRSTQIDLAATEAGNFADQALDASKLVPRTDWRAVNSAIQAGQTQTSDPNLQKLLVATDALINARARAISPSGQPHLSDQIEGRRLLSTAQSPETYDAAVRQMLAEVSGVKSATRSIASERGLEHSPDDSEEKFVNGKVYRDASGKHAKYQNGQWIPVP